MAAAYGLKCWRVEEPGELEPALKAAVATDGPTLGGVDPRRALMTYWALGTRGMVGVEFLKSVGKVPANKSAYFLFAAVKVRDCHGGPGRAICLY